MKKIKDIIIDTDPGHDDALAIMLAVKSNKFNIHMISTVAGNSTLENTTRNARYLLNLLKRNDIPVYSGASKPLKRELVQAFVHGKSGLQGIDPKIEANLNGKAIDKIIATIKENPGKITLVTLGPLTNIAIAIQKDPETMLKLKDIVIMGGAINVPGNQNGVSEFNMFVDPEAADIVFSFNIKKTLIPLDACNDIIMQIEDFNKLKGSDLHKPIISMIKHYIKNTEKDLGINGAFMYDPLTIYSLLNLKICKTNIYEIKVKKDSEKTRGKFITKLKENIQNPRDTLVIEKIPKNAFINDFIKTLSK